MNDIWRRSFPSLGGVYGHTKNQDVPNVFLEILPIYVTFVCLLWAYLVKPIQKIVLTCRKLWCLSACKKSASLIISFVRSCKDITYLLWILYAYLVTLIKCFRPNIIFCAFLQLIQLISMSTSDIWSPGLCDVELGLREVISEKCVLITAVFPYKDKLE